MSITASRTGTLAQLLAALTLLGIAGWSDPGLAGNAEKAPPYIPKGIGIIPWPEAAPQAETETPEAEDAAPQQTEESAVPSDTVPPQAADAATSADTVPAREQVEVVKAEDTAPQAAPAVTQPDVAGKKEVSIVDTTTYRHLNPYRARADQRREQQNARIKALRDDRERWRSHRRWLNNPRAEERRQWNRARSRHHRDAAELRRSAHDRYRRPYYGYVR